MKQKVHGLAKVVFCLHKQDVLIDKLEKRRQKFSIIRLLQGKCIMSKELGK